MGALTLVLDEVQNRFGISEAKAGSLLSGLLSLISQQSGGVSGFLDRFKSAGLGDTVSSWLGGSAKALIPEQVESVLGSGTISNLAAKAGVPAATASSAVAFMLPKLVQSLAPGGAIPSRLPAEFMSYITGPTAAVAAGARQAAHAVEGAAERSGIARFLWPLLALLAVAILGLWLWNRSGSTQTAVFNAEEQVRLAAQKATAALASLKPGFTAGDLVGALNYDVINFATGSAQIPADNYDFLNKAAVVIKMAPSGTVIEIAGNTDNTGDSASNLQLSQQRADSVRDYLVKQGVDPSVLVAKGYGDTKPVAANDTEEGKFRNRRIQFSVAH
jgi:outer membrane protein OmpA-like peptidoglycan-associated protein/uncharacterized protein YidB (DUF937 family)